MRVKFLSVLLVAVFMLAGLSMFSPPALAAGGVGYIEVQRVFAEYKETKVAKEKMAKEEEAFKKEFEKRQKEIETAKNNPKMKESELNELIAKKSTELEPLKEKISKLNQSLLENIQKNIVNTTEAVAKKLGIELVFDKQVIITGGTNLTDKVLYQLNQSK